MHRRPRCTSRAPPSGVQCAEQGPLTVTVRPLDVLVCHVTPAIRRRRAAAAAAAAKIPPDAGATQQRYVFRVRLFEPPRDSQSVDTFITNASSAPNFIAIGHIYSLPARHHASVFLRSPNDLVNVQPDERQSGRSRACSRRRSRCRLAHCVPGSRLARFAQHAPSAASQNRRDD
jgi:hypothetical protein